MYGKVFSSLWNGSLRGRPDEQLVFIYMIAHADEDGVVDIIVDKIIDDTGLDGDAVTRAIKTLESPDLCSRTPGEEGRRLVPLYEHAAWGWRIVNYEHYRSLRDADQRRRQNREAQARFKSKQRSATVSHGKPQSAQVEVEVEEEVEEKKNTLAQLARTSSSLSDSVSEAIDNSNKMQKLALRGVELAARAKAIAQEFGAFWACYPRRVGRGGAEKAFKSAVKRHPELELVDFTHAAQWYAEAVSLKGTEERFIPHATTWLNQDRFLEEYGDEGTQATATNGVGR